MGKKSFSNLYGIKSKSIIDALTHDDYDLADKPDNVYSCTEIIDSPKNKVLTKRHSSEIISDVSDNFWTLDGSAIHFAVEMSNKNKEAERLSEERIFIQIYLGEGFQNAEFTAHTLPKGEKITDQEWYNTDDVYVSVKFDNYEYDEACIEDYKRTSVWEGVKGLKISRVHQLNIGAFGMRLIGFPVKKIRACLMLKDWSAKDLKANERKCAETGWKQTYPLIPYKEYEPEVWTDEVCRNFILNRVSLHMEAHKVSDDEIFPCTEEERWYRGESFAVMKTGNKKATKVFKTEDFNDDRERALSAAEDYCKLLQKEKPGDTFIVETRPGNDVRCNGDVTYCHCKQYCNYWKEKYGQNVLVDTGEY